MKELIKHTWYPIIKSKKIPSRGIVERRIFGEDYIVYRDEKKSIRIKERWCPHRGADMKKGIIKKSCIACPYHGWEFNHIDGRLEKIPSQKKTNVKLKLGEVQFYDDGHILWCYYGNGKSCAISSPVNLLEDGHVTSGMKNCKCNWKNVIENSLDASHPNFVHDKSFSDSDNACVKIKKLDINEYGFESIVEINHKDLQELTTDVKFNFNYPNVTHIEFERSGKKFQTVVTTLPKTENETDIYWYFVQNSLKSENTIMRNIIDCVIYITMDMVLNEDIEILENLKPNFPSKLYVKADIMQNIFHYMLKYL